MSGEDLPMRLAVSRVLPGAEIIGWLKVVESDWRGIVSIFAARSGQAYVWRDSEGTPQVVLRTVEIDTPGAAIRAWLNSTAK